MEKSYITIKMTMFTLNGIGHIITIPFIYRHKTPGRDRQNVHKNTFLIKGRPLFK